MACDMGEILTETEALELSVFALAQHLPSLVEL